MQRRHLRGVLRIENQVYPRPWTLGLFLSELGQRDSRVYLVARVGGTVVGYGGLMVVLPDAHMTTVAVDPAWRHSGIGTRLVLALARAAIDHGVDNLTLEVRMSNGRAQALYRRFGFAPAGVRKGYYAETDEDALVMWVNDVRTPTYHARLDAIETSLFGTTTPERGAHG
jgi:ribosomal-protein-alanine N-acetyltransferase